MSEAKELRIIRLTVKNFKRLEAVEIQVAPGGGLVVIRGKNAQGKSSTLDGIMAALCGAREIPEMALREGTDEGFIRVDLGEYVVERTFKLDADGKAVSSKLEVRTAEGAKFAKPQALLDEVVGKIAFDPLAFVRLDGRAQVAELMAVADVQFDLDEWGGKRRAKYDERTMVNRDAKRLAAQVEGLPYHAGLPAVVPSTSELVEKVKATQERNGKRRLDRKLYENLCRQKDELLAALSAAEDLLEPEEPMEALEDELLAAEEMKAKLDANTARAAAEKEAAAASKKAEDLTAEINTLDLMRDQFLAHAELPVAGLAFDEDGVTYQGVPFGQCAASEQMMVSTAIAMAANPALRVVLIRDGSLLDVDGREALRKLAEAEGYQVWFECVEGAGGFVIHEGRVVGAEEETV